MIRWIKKKWRSYVIHVANREFVIAEERSDAARITERTWLQDVEQQRQQFKQHLKVVYKNHVLEKKQLKADVHNRYREKIDVLESEIASLRRSNNEKDEFVKFARESWIVTKNLSYRLGEKVSEVDQLSALLRDRYSECHAKSSRIVDEVDGIARFVKKVDAKMGKLLRLDATEEEAIMKRLLSEKSE